MSNIYKVQVGRRGVITFPKELRDKKNIKDGMFRTLLNCPMMFL
jgi:bifunctional DNA-binding transcriptional regulator/antitoxin component of YhaV-PrlF toxin-antitoxin module